MNDRGGMYMIGKVILVLALLAVAGVGLAVYSLSDHKVKDATAELQLVTAEEARAELAAGQPYMGAIAAEEARQQVAQLQSNGQTRALQDEAYRQQILDTLEHQRQLRAEKVAWQQALHRLAAQLLQVAGLTVIVGAGVVSVYTLLKNVQGRATVQALAQAAVQPWAAAQPPQATAPAPAPVARPPRPQPITGRLPDLPQGRPKRERPERPRPAPRPAPTAPTPAIRVAPLAGPALTVTNDGHGNGHSRGLYSNGHNGHNGASPNGHGAGRTGS